MKKVKFKKTLVGAHKPTKVHEQDAGFDLYAVLTEPIAIRPNETVFIDTGISIELPKNTFGAVFARSGLSCKNGLAPANKVGVIDNTYRGNIKVALHNHSSENQIVDNGDRIAQLVVMPFIPVDMIEVVNLSETSRGAGGFGSSGKA